MKEKILTVSENRLIAKNTWRMELSGLGDAAVFPGQFVNLALDGFYLRRPISVCDMTGSGDDHGLVLIYKVVGSGTEKMSRFKGGERLNVLTGLGNGYSLTASGEHPLLIGGGAGVPPLYYLARKLRALEKEVTVVLGFNTREEVFYEEAFPALGCRVLVTTADGSYGIKGFVTDALPDDATYYYACGPEPMLKAVYKALPISGELSFEERMGCGFGACMGCSCKTITGYKRICKDGPVLRKEEILWDA
ncbi:MAG: dihydroorotate dehydrogenase electron transfer subunit [Firmicutes bacterium]|nr:dihydroorotate dehydrogenase electron transfer subunit [Bacillota bacterium]